MSKKFSTKLKEGNWVDWEDGVKIRLRPFPMSKVNMSGDNISSETTQEMFNYCIVDWEGIVDDDDKPIKCNKEMKIYIYDHFLEFVKFIMESLTNLMAEGRELKN